MDRRRYRRDRFESYLEVSLAGLSEETGRGEDQKDHQVCVHMAKVGDGVINEDGENRRKSSPEEEDSKIGFGCVECPWRAAWMPQSGRPSFASWFYH